MSNFFDALVQDSSKTIATFSRSLHLPLGFYFSSLSERHHGRERTAGERRGQMNRGCCSTAIQRLPNQVGPTPHSWPGGCWAKALAEDSPVFSSSYGDAMAAERIQKAPKLAPTEPSAWAAKGWAVAIHGQSGQSSYGRGASKTPS